MNLWTTAVFPVATLVLGAGLTYLAQSRSRRERERFEDGRRWHEAKRDAYARLLSASTTQTSSISEALMRPECLKHKSESIGSGWEQIMAANRAVRSTLDEVRLLGSLIVVAHGDRLLSALNMTFAEMSGFEDGDGTTDADFEDHVHHAAMRVEGLERIVSQMLSEMRAELGTAKDSADPVPDMHKEPWFPWFNQTQYFGPTHGAH